MRRTAVSKKCIAGSIWCRMLWLSVWDVYEWFWKSTLREKKKSNLGSLCCTRLQLGMVPELSKCSMQCSFPCCGMKVLWSFFFFAGLGSSPRLEIPTDRANRLETMRTARVLSCKLRHLEAAREAGLTHRVTGREWMEADLISTKWNCSTASLALAFID